RASSSAAACSSGDVPSRPPPGGGVGDEGPGPWPWRPTGCSPEGVHSVLMASATVAEVAGRAHEDGAAGWTDRRALLPYVRQVQGSGAALVDESPPNRSPHPATRSAGASGSIGRCGRSPVADVGFPRRPFLVFPGGRRSNGVPCVRRCLRIDEE